MKEKWPVIGNDIVDIERAVSTTNWKRKGYLQKLFTEEEQRIILNSEFPEIQIWKYWSMKEAAYKAHHRRFRLARKFNPVQYNCNETSEGLGTVIKDNYRYKTATSSSVNFIHTIASVNNNGILFSEVFMDSEAIKEMVITHFASVNQLQKEQVTVKKDENYIPHLYLDNKIHPVNFSITHHGNFSAYVIPLTNY